ncbi:hypothetical protein Goshw_012720, partial [Gossypium schwendimanii]|nr:hypothetical protein [Gossypium schwendimanii]
GEELKNSRAANQVEGYGHDLIVSERQVLDWNTRLFLRIMSNRIFKSPVHKAVTNTDKPRISVAMSNEAEVDKEIGPVEALIDD